jgi:hypothetical protein
MRGPISVIGNTSSAIAASCQFRNSIRMMPAISSRNGSAALLAKLLIELSNAVRSMEKRDRILAALGLGEIGRRQVLDVLEDPRPHVGDQGRREPRVHALVPDRNDRCGDAATASTPRIV